MWLAGRCRGRAADRVALVGRRGSGVGSRWRVEVGHVVWRVVFPKRHRVFVLSWFHVVGCVVEWWLSVVWVSPVEFLVFVVHCVVVGGTTKARWRVQGKARSRRVSLDLYSALFGTYPSLPSFNHLPIISKLTAQRRFRAIRLPTHDDMPILPLQSPLPDGSFPRQQPRSAGGVPVIFKRLLRFNQMVGPSLTSLRYVSTNVVLCRTLSSRLGSSCISVSRPNECTWLALHLEL